MNFCGNCGNRVDGLAFCGNCGTAVESVQGGQQTQPVYGQYSQPTVQSKGQNRLSEIIGSMSSQTKIITASAVGAVVLAVVLILLLTGNGGGRDFPDDDFVRRVEDVPPAPEVPVAPAPPVEVAPAPAPPTAEAAPPQPEILVIPDFAGLTIIQIMQNAQWISVFSFNIVGEEFSEIIPADAIISQSPLANTSQALSPYGERITIDLVVSRGTEFAQRDYETEIYSLIVNKLAGFSSASQANDPTLVTQFINPYSPYYEATVNLINHYEARNIFVDILSYTILEIRQEGEQFYVDVIEDFAISSDGAWSGQVQWVTYTVDEVHGELLLSRIVIHEIETYDW